LSHEASTSIKKTLHDCFETYCEKTLFWLKVNAKPVLPVVDLNLIQTLLYMLDGYLGPQHVAAAVAGVTSSGSAATNASAPNGNDILETVFVYCAVWAFGSTLAVADDGTDYKRLFSDCGGPSGAKSSSQVATRCLITDWTPRRTRLSPGPSPRTFTVCLMTRGQRP